jgi:hypothetical protein
MLSWPLTDAKFREYDFFVDPFEDDLDRKADTDLGGRTVDETGKHPATLFECDQNDRVGHFVGEARVVDLMHDRETEDLAPPGNLDPLGPPVKALIADGPSRESVYPTVRTALNDQNPGRSGLEKGAELVGNGRDRFGRMAHYLGWEGAQNERGVGRQDATVPAR